MTHGDDGRHAVKAASKAPNRARRRRRRDHGLRQLEGATGANIAGTALRGLPGDDRGHDGQPLCSSGLQAIAIAAQRVLAGEGEVYVAGGVESISCVQNEMNTHMLIEGWLKQNKPEIYWPMLQTAETVAKRYNIARERQDEYGVRSQQRAASAAAGKFTDEIVPMTTMMATADKDGRMFTKGDDRHR
jgi:acetyl-CoA C-acetyltransferase